MLKEEVQSVWLVGEHRVQVVTEWVAILGLVRIDCLVKQWMGEDCKGRYHGALEAVVGLEMAGMIQKEHKC